MDDPRITRLEVRLADLERSLAAMTLRVASFERSGPTTIIKPAAESSTLGVGPGTGLTPTELMALVGRTVVVLGGGFLLRALTEAGSLPSAVGVALGMLYAGLSVIAADRAAGGGRDSKLSATFHAVAALALAVPLVYEAAAKFALLSATSAAVTLAAIGLVVSAVAWRRQGRAIAWVAGLATVLGSFALMGAMRTMVPFIGCLLLQGVLTFWLGEHHDWRGLRWVVAVPTATAVLALTERAVVGRSPDGGSAILATQLAFLAVYFGSFVAKHLRFPARRLQSFEAALTLAAFAIGLGGAVRVSSVTGAGGWGLGLAGLALASGSYALAASARGGENWIARNLVFGSAGFLALSLGAGRLLGSGPLAVVLSVVAVVAAWATGRGAGPLGSSHVALYLLLASAVSGMLTGAARALMADSQVSWFQLESVASVAVSLAGAAGLWLLCRRPAPVGTLAAAARVVALVVVTLAAVLHGVVAAVALVPAIAEPAYLAALRTVLLTSCVALLAWARRWLGLREAGWLVAPLLTGAGIKIVLVDLSSGHPTTLFVALGSYGAGLILAARWGRSKLSVGA